MVTLQWRPELNVGIDFIDTDHQKIVELIIELSGLLRPGELPGAALEKLDEIIEFSRQHFHLEERLMSQSGYQQFERHKQMHEMLLRDIVAHRQQLAAGERNAARETMDFLEHWLMDHILESDKDLGSHLNRRLSAGDDQRE